MRLAAEVLVVGGGPAGAAAAAELALRGRQVLLADASEGPRDRVCGEFVSAEAVPLLRRVGALAAVQHAGPSELRRARFTTPAGGALDMRVDGGALGLSRRLLDEALLQAAARRGAQLLRGARFVDLCRDGDGRPTGARLRTPGGIVQVEAALILGADGRGSAVARAAAWDQPAGGPRHCAIKAHFRGPGFDRIEGQVEIHLFPGGYVGMQPVEDGRVNVSAVVEAGLARRLRGGALAILLAALQPNPQAARRMCGARAAGRPLTLFPLERRRRAVLGDGLLLAGDAAQVVPPFVGDGIAAALCSGLLAADTARHALQRGDVSAAALSAYAAGRRRHLALPVLFGRALERVIYHPRLAAALVPWLQRTPMVPQFLLRSTRLR